MDPNNPNFYQNLITSPNSPVYRQPDETQTNSQALDLAITYDDSTSLTPNYGFNTMWPGFSSQCAIGGEASASAKTKKKGSKSKKQLAIGLEASANPTQKQYTPRQQWTIEEDKVLVGAYLNTSKDSCIGTDRSSANFWTSIAADYNKYTTSGGMRDDKSCKNRWHLINGQVGKFVGYYHQATDRKKSGESESDVIRTAHTLFESDLKKKFTLVHAWYLLRDDPKWALLGEGSSTKRTRINVEGNYSSSSSAGGSMPTTPGTPCTPSSGTTDHSDCAFTMPEPVRLRPIGVKAAKRKAKVNSMPSVEEGAEATMNEFNTTQSKMADAIKMAAETKQLKMYQQLASKESLTSREEGLLQLLHAKLFPKEV